MDVAGDNQLNVEHEMIKQRLTKHGMPIGKAGIEIIGEVFCWLIFFLILCEHHYLVKSRVLFLLQISPPTTVVLVTVLKLIW
jgi:hypothetical protein